MNKNQRQFVLIMLLIIGAIAIYAYLRRKPQESEPVPGPVSGKLVIRFLDIGQGDAELIQLPTGETILIDSGDRGKPTVDLLKNYGVKEINLAIATHPHADHIGEMRDVMRAFKVHELWDSGFNNPTSTYTNMLQEVKAQGVKFSTPKQGESRRFGDVLVEVLHPAQTLPDDNANNASIVVRLTFGSKRFLFTGDTEVQSWQQMLDTEKDKLRADLLKAAHHGSSNGTTKDILDAVRPSIYTISCAIGNDYHHPHPKVVDLLENNKNIKPYRTDLQGTITAVCDGNSIEMSTEKQVAADKLYLTGDEAAGK
ncbi:MAG TPA: ComEC/Rec2 family competence protein, partial [Blastocatellia bacterium]|nr:ComEC/Rec2 family competence protein [Blastocatellia bacterium]